MLKFRRLNVSRVEAGVWLPILDFGSFDFAQDKLWILDYPGKPDGWLVRGTAWSSLWLGNQRESFLVV